jgi:hypothetical protein
MRLMKVSRKAAITAEAQSTELDTMSSTISSTLTGLKDRFAQSAESAAAISSDLLDSVSFLLFHSLELADMQHAAASERFDQTYAESSKNVKSVLASTSTFLSSGILDDVPTGITPKKKTWNVPQSWERTEPREALLEAFRRRKVDSDDIETETNSIPSSPEDLPTVASVESIPSVTSLPVSKMRKPTGKMEKLDLSGGVKEERVVVPLGETLGNIPVPRRVRR